MSKDAWKNAGKSSTADTQGKRQWQQGPKADPKSAAKPSKNRSRLFIALGALVVVLGGFIALIVMPKPPRSAALVLIGSGYEENLAIPHNVYGWKGLLDMAQGAEKTSLLSRLSWVKPDKLRLLFGPQEVTSGKTWEEIWAEVPRNFEEKNLILYLALHGGANADGAYLLANDPTTKTRIRIEEVLKSLKDPELADKNIVLILDATQVAAHWQTGMLTNDFARKLKSLEKEIEEIPNLMVLSSSDMNQRSWVSEQWQQSIFVHFVIDGLRGAADADKNNRLTVLELHDYVREKVKSWAEANRDASQVPVLLGGADRAASIELVQLSEPQEGQVPSDAPGVEFNQYDQMRTAWNECRTLSKQIPAPEVYSPHWWRCYRDTLVRYEQILRAGDPTNKKVILRNKLNQLSDTIRSSGIVFASANSLGNSLIMPRMLGIVPSWSQKELSSQLRDVWQAEGDINRKKAWDKLMAWAKGAGTTTSQQQKQLLQVELGKEVMAKLVQKKELTQIDLEQAADLLKRWVNGKSLRNLRATEVHFLVMLFYDEIAPPTQPLVEDLRLALEVRLLAERTALAATGENSQVHLYSEQVMPWIQEKVNQGDHSRRLGEDWLFGSDKSSWEKARKYLSEGKSAYESALKDAMVVQKAYDQQDRALADLPHYAHWAAGHPLGKEQLLKDVESLAQSIDDLSKLLGRANPKGEWIHQPLSDAPPQQNYSLKSLTKEVNRKLDDLRIALVEECDRLLKERADHQENWHMIENVLATPLIESNIRIAMLEESRRISNKLHDGRLKFEGHKVNADDLANQARTWAQHQGWMALTVAGKSWQLDRAFSRKEFGQAGGYLAETFQKRRQNIHTVWEESIDSPDLKVAAKKLKSAEYSCRRISGGEASLIPNDPFDPVIGMRRLRTHDLLLWQAKRSQQDHWFADSDDPKATYYIPAATAYLKDARRLAAGRPGEKIVNKKRSTAVDLAEKHLTLTQVNVKENPEFHVTTEQKFALAWNLKADPKLPSGIPMVWLDAEGPFKNLSDNLYKGRLPIQGWLDSEDGDAGTLEKRYFLESSIRDERVAPPLVPKVVKGQANIRGVYRGQRISSKTELFVHQSPEVIMSKYPPPPETKVAIRLQKGVSYGALCIVIDMSGSMKDPLQKFGKTKLAFARESLQKVLAKIPDGTYLSIQSFSHKSAPKMQDPDGNVRREWLRKPTPWYGKRELTRTMDKLYSLDPLYTSPIARSLDEARENGFPDNYQGPKVLLALTDGEDTEFNKGNRIGIPQFLKNKFTGSRIAVNVVCFTQNEQEAKKAEKQFDIVKALEPPGRFYNEKSGEKLAQTLEEALRPKVRLYQNLSAVTDLPKGIMVSRHEQNVQWKTLTLKSTTDDFGARLQSAKLQDIRLQRGERLLLSLVQGLNGTLRFKREVYAKLVQDNKDRLNYKDNWLVGVLQNGIFFEEARLEQLLSFEDYINTKPGPQEIVRHYRPGFMWLEVTNKKTGKSPKGLQWYNDFDYPAPTIRAHSGPFGPEASKVSVWWVENQSPEDKLCTRLRHVPESSTLEDLRRNANITVAGFPVTIEKLQVEDRHVSIAPPKRFGTSANRAIKSCLVVQLKHDPKKPVVVQGLNLGHRGEEHHFFTHAGKYTAFFWGVSIV